MRTRTFTHTQARCKVLMAGKAKSFVIAEELFFDEGRGVITAGGNKMKVSGWHTEVAVVAFCVRLHVCVAV